jgi:hypothetical protein
VTDPVDDDLVPVSVRLGAVVPPEDPEDWTRPLTWVAALGMLAAPLAALAWFVITPPLQSGEALPMTFFVATVLAAGAAATGATQQGIARASTATLGAALFAGLVVIIVGAVMAGQRQVGAASPTLAHAVAASAGGVAGSAAAAVVAGAVARLRARPIRFLLALVIGTALAVLAVGTLLPAPTAAG